MDHVNGFEEAIRKLAHIAYRKEVRCVDGDMVFFPPEDKLGKRKGKRRCQKVPLAQKELLTLREAAAYTGIGINRLRRMSDDEDCSFVLWVGSKRMLKRRELEQYLAEAYSV